MHMNLHTKETKLAEVAFFDEPTEDEEITRSQPRGLPLPQWEALEGQKQSLIKKIC